MPHCDHQEAFTAMRACTHCMLLYHTRISALLHEILEHLDKHISPGIPPSQPDIEAPYPDDYFHRSSEGARGNLLPEPDISITIKTLGRFPPNATIKSKYRVVVPASLTLAQFKNCVGLDLLQHRPSPNQGRMYTLVVHAVAKERRLFRSDRKKYVAATTANWVETMAGLKGGTFEMIEVEYSDGGAFPERTMSSEVTQVSRTFL